MKYLDFVINMLPKRADGTSFDLAQMEQLVKNLNHFRLHLIAMAQSRAVRDLLDYLD
jgi:hypothetical protein